MSEFGAFTDLTLRQNMFLKEAARYVHTLHSKSYKRVANVEADSSSTSYQQILPFCMTDLT